MASLTKVEAQRLERLKNYFIKDQNLSVDLIEGTTKFNINTKTDCKKLFFEETFFNADNTQESVSGGKEKISCLHYDQVVSGEGNENDKIDSFHSSSLQSLLFFCGVSETPLWYKGVKYTEAIFKWRNPVITFPSSIDVVLVGNKRIDGKDRRVIMFVESKLYEVIRDSNTRGTHEIGSSYFADDQDNSYQKRLGLNENDYTTLGIKKDDTDKKKRSLIKSHSKNSYVENGKQKEGYVYSYGIKQMLSHIIGILNFIDNQELRVINNPGKNIANADKDYDVVFLTLINGFPGFEDKDRKRKIRHFITHYNEVINCLKDKPMFKKSDENNEYGVKISLEDCMTYQTFFQEISNQGEKSFNLPNTIQKYYHLTDKDDYEVDNPDKPVSK